jgi:aminopeptidase N
MLMRIMCEDQFFAGLADYFAKHQYQNTTADDLWDALSNHADFDVKEFMTPWLTQSGYPVVDAATGKQHRFLLSGKDKDYQYPIRELEDDLSGHYLIKLSEAALNEKLVHLSELNKEQKLRLLIDQRYLAKTSEVSSVSLFKLLDAFKEEKDAVVWDMISVIVNDLKIFFDPYTEQKRAFQRRVGDIARGQFERLGVVAKENDTDNDRRLRATIMGLMRFSKDNAFRQQIEEAYADKDIAKVDGDLRWVVAAALLRENNELSPKYFNIYCTTVDAALKRDIGGALAASRDEETLLGYLPKLMDGTIRPQDRFGFYYRLVGNYVSQDGALQWMFDNWDWLAKEEGDKTIADYPRYVATIIRQEEPARKYREFFMPKIDHPSLTRDIKVGLADIDAKLQLIKEDQAAIYKELGF